MASTKRTYEVRDAHTSRVLGTVESVSVRGARTMGARKFGTIYQYVYASLVEAPEAPEVAYVAALNAAAVAAAPTPAELADLEAAAYAQPCTCNAAETHPQGGGHADYCLAILAGNALHAARQAAWVAEHPATFTPHPVAAPEATPEALSPADSLLAQAQALQAALIDLDAWGEWEIGEFEEIKRDRALDLWDNSPAYSADGKTRGDWAAERVAELIAEWSAMLKAEQAEQAEQAAPVYTVVIHTPGCLPESDPYLTADFEDAAAVWRSEVRGALDQLEDDGEFLEHDTKLHATSVGDIAAALHLHKGYAVTVDGTRYALEIAE